MTNAGSSGRGGDRDNGRETFEARVEMTVAELEDAERAPTDEGDELLVAGRPFAVVGRRQLIVALDPAVAAAALRTPDVTAAPRGDGWVTFAPAAVDQFALDRAEAWLRSAHRRAKGGR